MPPDDELDALWHLLGTRLPVRLRERAWCTVCQRTLEAGTVRCPEHPEGEVMLVLRDEETP